ncbi:MAG: divalent-cation tolerance protein CutA [Candidatus Hadarchaeota archaeon]|nr:divalent-cation tolerance protein CutA [Candidatus Hadarchaeota archaeon]
MFHVVLVTAKDSAEAKRIGELLVKEKLAAGANVIPGVNSTYWWKGKIESSNEVLLLLKTSHEKLDDLIDRVKELHSYETPEVLALHVEKGSPDYLKWLEESLR